MKYDLLILLHRANLLQNFLVRASIRQMKSKKIPTFSFCSSYYLNKALFHSYDEGFSLRLSVSVLDLCIRKRVTAHVLFDIKASFIRDLLVRVAEWNWKLDRLD